MSVPIMKPMPYLASKRFIFLIISLFAVTVYLAPTPARADVCGMSTTGGEPQGADGSVGTGVPSVACGIGDSATAAFTVAIGGGNTASAVGASALGSDTIASGVGAIGVGSTNGALTVASGTLSIAIGGNGTTESGAHAIAVGPG